ESTDPGTGVGPVIGEGLARPIAGDEHPTSADAEGGFLVDAPLAVAGAQPCMGFLGLDAVEKPVGAPVRAWGDTQRLPEPLDVVPLCVRGRLVAVGGALG